MKTITKLYIGLGILAVLTPLGLLIPDHFKAGTAWGEWGVDEIKELVGYVPKKLEKLSELWKAPLPDYAFKGWEEKGMAHLSFAYIVSAVVGICIIAAITMLIGKLLAKREN
ncbi:MAG: cobalamin biosynthesis protein [Elusimicrobia bacterium CG_4_10_14_0_8_um_filter_37_32]|nr:MAG: cobalamin biosynthesis protein [Elusimicrobia bacterium CG_4_10_14_0_8_um_filter_37_32]